MALDFLSAPATSVDTERAFSRGALTVTYLRHALSDESTQNSIVGGSWAKDGFVPEDELIELFERTLSRIQTLVSDNGTSLEALSSQMEVDE